MYVYLDVIGAYVACGIGTQALGLAIRGNQVTASDLSAHAADDKWEGVDRGWFESLRSLRMAMATERGVPPYVVFGDVTLRELARYRPTSVSSLLKIYGIGQQKRNEFGAAIVAAIKEYCQDANLPTDVAATTTRPRQSSTSSDSARKPQTSAASAQYFELFDEGLTRDEVAHQLDRAVSTVTGHVTTYIFARKIDDASAFIPATTVTRISQAIERYGTERLKPIYEALEQTVSYDDIRIVVACHKVADNA